MVVPEGMPEPVELPVGLVRSPAVLTFNDLIWGGRF
jgi:hypothetical protein